LGHPVKVLEVGEVIQLQAEGDKFGERPGITVAHVHNKVADNTLFCNMLMYLGHYRKLTEFLRAIGHADTNGKLRIKSIAFNYFHFFFKRPASFCAAFVCCSLYW
jgi:hypothetical protein